MRTSEFIAALAADPVPEPIRLGRRVAAAIALGVIVSLAIYALLMGPRPDIADAARTVRFNLKFVDAFAFALPSLLLTLRLARPDAKPRAIALWLLAPLILLAAGVVVELIVVPSNEWLSRLVGHHSMFCMRMIPLLASPDTRRPDRRAARGRAAPSGIDRRARGRRLRRHRSADLRFALSRRFAAVRGHLVSARHPHLYWRGSVGRPAVSGLVRRTGGRTENATF